MKNKQDNLITWKIEFSCEFDLFDIINDYNKVLKFTYNRLLDNPELTTKEIFAIQKTMHKSNFIGSHLCNSAIYDAKAIVKHSDDDKAIIFGGKNLFVKRCQHKITKESFIHRRLVPLYSVGEANQFGNRLFTIVDKETIMFKLDRNHHYMLELKNLGKNRNKQIKKLIDLQNNKAIAITYKLSERFIYITFDYNKLVNNEYKVKENRVFAIDMNPNYIGWSVVDWISEDKHNTIASGSISIKPLNDYQNSLKVSSDNCKSKYIKHKRDFETIEIAKQLLSFCKHYKCEIFSIEDLDIETKDNNKGKKFNKMVNNQWNRNLLFNQLKKLINCSSTIFVPVKCQYSSYIGNLLHRQEHLPDECLASIEVGRRGFEYSTQYIFKRRPQQKTVIFPNIDLVKNQLSISLEEIGIDVPKLNNWKNICSEVKKSKKKYRFSLEEAIKYHSSNLFSKFYYKKYVVIHTFL